MFKVVAGVQASTSHLFRKSFWKEDLPTRHLEFNKGLQKLNLISRDALKQDITRASTQGWLRQ